MYDLNLVFPSASIEKVCFAREIRTQVSYNNVSKFKFVLKIYAGISDDENSNTSFHYSLVTGPINKQTNKKKIKFIAKDFHFLECRDFDISFCFGLLILFIFLNY